MKAVIVAFGRVGAGLAAELARAGWQVLIMDTTSAAFDQLTRELQATLGLTVFLITHDLDTLYEICDRVAVLADKRVIAVGTIPELLATDHPWIQEYFNGPRGRAAKSTLDRAKGMDKPMERKA